MKTIAFAAAMVAVNACDLSCSQCDSLVVNRQAYEICLQEVCKCDALAAQSLSEYAQRVYQSASVSVDMDLS